MFKKAIVRQPGKEMVHGITTANLGKPDISLALQQHAAYVTALESCGLEVTILEPDNRFPDSTFVEDTALLTPKCAIITRPGAVTRRGETIEMESVLKRFFTHIEKIEPPGTIEAGDILPVEDTYFIGLSQRTNREGADQIIRILKKYGYTGIKVSPSDTLHLKTGVAYLGRNNLVVTGEFGEKRIFRSFNLLKIPEQEKYAANCILINGKVLLAKGFSKSKELIESAGYQTIELEVSEFRKLDGGLSCLSLRF